MAELCESSGLHSLASLREHEKRRAQQQAEAARARAEAEQHARQEAARIEHERRLAARAALEYAESAQRAELVRLETAERTEFERAEGLARASAALKSELDRERAARQSVEFGLTARLLRQRLWTSASIALYLASGLSAAGLYFGALRPNAQHALATLRQSLLVERETRTAAEQREARSRLRADELSARVGSLEQDLRAEHARLATQSLAPIPLRKPNKREPLVIAPSVKPCRDDGDPLNPCLKH